MRELVESMVACAQKIKESAPDDYFNGIDLYIKRMHHERFFVAFQAMYGVGNLYQAQLFFTKYKSTFDVFELPHDVSFHKINARPRVKVFVAWA